MGAPVKSSNVRFVDFDLSSGAASSPVGESAVDCSSFARPAGFLESACIACSKTDRQSIISEGVAARS